MSSHSVKSKKRHPQPINFEREHFKFGHMTLEIIDKPKVGVSFCLLAGPPDNLIEKKPMCTGFMKSNFARDLSKILQRVLELKDENKLPDKCSENFCDNDAMHDEHLCVVCYYDEAGKDYE